MLRLQLVVVPRTFYHCQESTLNCHFQSINVYQFILRHVIIVIEYLIDLFADNLHVTVAIGRKVDVSRYLTGTAIPIIDISDAATRSIFLLRRACSVAANYSRRLSQGFTNWIAWIQSPAFIISEHVINNYLGTRVDGSI